MLNMMGLTWLKWPLKMALRMGEKKSQGFFFGKRNGKITCFA